MRLRFALRTFCAARDGDSTHDDIGGVVGRGGRRRDDRQVQRAEAAGRPGCGREARLPQTAGEAAEGRLLVCRAP